MNRQIASTCTPLTKTCMIISLSFRSLLLFCARPRTADNLKRNVPQLMQPSNLSSPGQSEDTADMYMHISLIRSRKGHTYKLYYKHIHFKYAWTT